MLLDLANLFISFCSLCSLKNNPFTHPFFNFNKRPTVNEQEKISLPAQSEHHLSYFLFIFFREATGGFISTTKFLTSGNFDIKTPISNHYLGKKVQNIIAMLKKLIACIGFPLFLHELHFSLMVFME